MIDGFIRTAAVTPRLKVADVEFNTEEIIKNIFEACESNTKIIVFPELSITGYTCHDLFLQDILIKKAEEALREILKRTSDTDALIFIGFPLSYECKLYNTAVIIKSGRVLAVVPKTNLPEYGEFYETRHFAKGFGYPVEVTLCGQRAPFGTNILIKCKNIPELVLACEICEDVWVPDTPSTHHATNGATVIANLSASDSLVCKDAYRKNLLQITSARLVSGYIYAGAGYGESTQDLVYGGHSLIFENGNLISERSDFENGILYGEIDVKRLAHDRRKMNTFNSETGEEYAVSEFEFKEINETGLTRKFDKMPFVPQEESEKYLRCKNILTIQAEGLKKRLDHLNCKHVFVGISGGLDSTLALLVCAEAFDKLGIPRKNIHAVTMPCFGTTDRTHKNAVMLSECFDTDLIEIDIKASVTQHFKDIRQDENTFDVTYENGQARERTKVLMDLANKMNGIVVGTGDMSELALGFATYNGDHMSMYAVNVGVPKTLVRHLVRFYADTCGNKKCSDVLYDVLNTPVSPELLPPKDDNISQITEDIVGPYVLHDFFLYHMLRNGYEPSKILRIAKIAFCDTYGEEEIKKWLKMFIKRFFSQQFKRSCIPDGPKVGSVALSPRGDLRMPSDACAALWLTDLE